MKDAGLDAWARKKLNGRRRTSALAHIDNAERMIHFAEKSLEQAKVLIVAIGLPQQHDIQQLLREIHDVKASLTLLESRVDNNT